MSGPPRLLVSGYYGLGNAGDEAILAGLLAGFRETAPQFDIVVLSGSPSATQAEHGVAAVPRGPAAAYRHARQCDLLVSGGGGLLQDVTSWRSPLYYLGVMNAARGAGKPVACIGQGIGPLRRKLLRAAVRRVLSRVDVLAVRDAPSRDALKDLGLARAIEVTADLAFLLPTPSPEEIAQAHRKCGLRPASEPIAAIALRASPGGGPGSELARALGAALDEACRRIEHRPALVPMHRPADVEFAQSVAGAMPSRPQLVSAALSARELLALLCGCGLVVAMRLHALAFAAIGAVPMAAISYDPKVDALMGRLGLEAATSVRQFEPEALARAIHTSWQARTQVSQQLRARVPELRAAAARNIDLACHLL